MRPVWVLADDLTGAAEIAGIANRLGCQVELSRVAARSPDSRVTVIDTDSRSLSDNDAASRMLDVLGRIDPPPGALLFKKTDSVFRGPIAAEIDAIVRRLGLRSAVLLAQNPSRGRTVRDGIYRIDGVPLDRTAFARDPTHPATSAHVTRLLGDHATVRSLPVDASIPTGSNEPPAALLVLDAASEDDVHRWASRLPANVLPAGGADFFTAWLSRVLSATTLGGPAEERSHLSSRADPIGGSPAHVSLLVRGTASPLTEATRGAIERRGFHWLAMPDAVLASNATDASPMPDWVRQLAVALDRHGAIAVHVDRAVDGSAGVPRRIEQLLAEATARVLAARHVDELMVEGGATASAICRRLRWERFAVVEELSPGIVRLRPMVQDAATPAIRVTPTLTIKPGSYPWPDLP